MTPRQIRNVIASALRTKAPAKYAEFERAGTLKAFLDSRTETAMQEIEEAENPGVMKALRPGTGAMESVQMLTEARKRAESFAIANAIDF